MMSYEPQQALAPLGSLLSRRRVSVTGCMHATSFTLNVLPPSRLQDSLSHEASVHQEDHQLPVEIPVPASECTKAAMFFLPRGPHLHLHLQPSSNVCRGGPSRSSESFLSKGPGHRLGLLLSNACCLGLGLSSHFPFLCSNPSRSAEQTNAIP